MSHYRSLCKVNHGNEGVTMADVNADLFAEIESGIERIAALTSEGNTEGAEELSTEISEMIDSIKGTGSVAKRKGYRDQLKSAKDAAPAPSTEVELKMPQTIAEVEGLEELVSLGAERVREVTESKLKGGRAIAEILFDMRRRIILPDGLPDLKGRSHAAKTASSEVYDRVTSALPAEGTDEFADGIRDEITSIKRSAQDAMVDVRVEYIRALDHSGPEELEAFAAAVKPNVQPSEAVAQYYGIKLQTRRELQAERRATAELTTGEGDIRKVAASIKRAVKTTESVDPSAVSTLDEKERSALKSDIKAQIVALNALLAQLA
jgi:hypothetical protein